MLGVIIPLTILSSLASKGALKLVFCEKCSVVRPPGKVSIIIPAWNEPKEFLLTATASLKNQNIVKAYPSYFEFILVDGVPYLNEVRQYYDVVVHAPPGKLNARNLAIMRASGDIIVSVDADTYYPPNWLNMMLQPYLKDPHVVATTGTKYVELFDHLVWMVKLPIYGGRISGRASTFKKKVFEAIGGFRTEGIDQRNADEMVIEEEIMFKKRLEQYGRVVLVDAPVIHLGENWPWKMMAGRGIRS